MDRIKDKKASVPVTVDETAFELSDVYVSKADEGFQDKTTPHCLTFKYAMVLFSLTLLWLSAAGPVFFITASIGQFSTFRP